MSNVQELEIAVSQLSAKELMQFSEWFEVFLADEWDKKLRATFWLVGWMLPTNVLMMNFSLVAQVHFEPKGLLI
jgi:hypothetical protein